MTLVQDCSEPEILNQGKRHSKTVETVSSWEIFHAALHCCLFPLLLPFEGMDGIFSFVVSSSEFPSVILNGAVIKQQSFYFMYGRMSSQKIRI